MHNFHDPEQYMIPYTDYFPWTEVFFVRRDSLHPLLNFCVSGFGKERTEASLPIPVIGRNHYSCCGKRVLWGQEELQLCDTTL